MTYLLSSLDHLPPYVATCHHFLPKQSYCAKFGLAKIRGPYCTYVARRFGAFDTYLTFGAGATQDSDLKLQMVSLLIKIFKVFNLFENVFFNSFFGEIKQSQSNYKNKKSPRFRLMSYPPCFAFKSYFFTKICKWQKYRNFKFLLVISN